MTFTQQQIRSARTSRALFASVAVILAALALVHLADGARVLGALTGFSAALFAMSALLAAHRIGIMKRAVARDEFRERMGVRISPGLPAPAVAPRSAWDVSMTLSPAVPWGDVWHYEDASRKPDGIADGVIRVIPRTAVRPWSLGAAVVTSWEVVTRAPSHGEGIDLLKAAEPLLRERLAEAAGPRARYFRLADGALAEVPADTAAVALGKALGVPMTDLAAGMTRLVAAIDPCAHPGAEPVDLLVTGERVAWVCPACNAELPAGWR